MTRKLLAVLLASLVLTATPFAGAAVAADSGNTAGNDSTDETAGNDSTMEGNETGNVSDGNVTAFGLQVSEFVHNLQSDNETSIIGPLVADFVVANNPGNAPTHAGPPAWLFGGGNESGNQTGPPARAGPSDNSTQGPPEGVGPSDNSTQGPPARAGPSDNSTQGPPGDAGPPEDTGPSGQQGPPSDGDKRRGPPADAGPS